MVDLAPLMPSSWVFAQHFDKSTRDQLTACSRQRTISAFLSWRIQPDPLGTLLVAQSTQKSEEVMKLTVKTLKGGKFSVEVEPSNTVAEAKGVIVSPALI